MALQLAQFQDLVEQTLFERLATRLGDYVREVVSSELYRLESRIDQMQRSQLPKFASNRSNQSSRCVIKQCGQPTQHFTALTSYSYLNQSEKSVEQIREDDEKVDSGEMSSVKVEQARDVSSSLLNLYNDNRPAKPLFKATHKKKAISMMSGGKLKT